MCEGRRTFWPERKKTARENLRNPYSEHLHHFHPLSDVTRIRIIKSRIPIEIRRNRWKNYNIEILEIHYYYLEDRGSKTQRNVSYVEIKCQLDATEVFIADLIACSTCFGHHYAHHQELKSIIQWLLPVVFRAVVFQVAGPVWGWGLCVRFAGCC